LKGSTKEISANVIDCHISRDSNYLIVTLQVSDELYKIRVYETQYFNLYLEAEIGEESNEAKYVKVQGIVENHNGTIFCVPYLEDGRFKLCFFDIKQILFHDNVSERLEIDKQYIKPNYNFPNPLISACFMNMQFKENRTNRDVNTGIILDEKMFVNVFVNHRNLMLGYIFDFEKK
jgi:hypothetical protein